MSSEQKDDPDELRIQEEIKLYGDILRLDMVDTYADLVDEDPEDVQRAASQI